MLKVLFAVLMISATANAQRLDSIEPNSGSTAGGTRVVMRGSLLQYCGGVATCPYPRVIFGDVEAIPISITPDTITVITPPHAPGRITVRYSYGGSLPNGFTYFDAGALAAVPTLSEWATGLLGIGLAHIALSRLRI